MVRILPELPVLSHLFKFCNFNDDKCFKRNRI